MGPKKKKEPLFIEGVNTTVLTREQLEKFALTLKETLDREREERNFFQLERDKIRTFWDITKQQLEDCKAELLNKERDLEEKENYHQNESKVIKQKVKHLVCEHHKNIAELRADSMISLQMTQEDFNEQEMALLTDKKNLKENLIEQQKAHQEELRNMNTVFSEELRQARSNFEKEAREIEAKYEDKLQTFKSESALRNSMEITQISEQKNQQISNLKLKHDKAFSEMKNYYNSLILNNLSLISNLREQMQELKWRGERAENLLKQCQKKVFRNRNLSETLNKTLAENKELKRQLENYAKDKAVFKEAQDKILQYQRDVEDLKWENEILELRLTKEEETRESFENNFSLKVMEAQQECANKNVLLEKKLKHLLRLLEQRELQFSEFLKHHKFDHAKLSHINLRLDKVLAKKNCAIEDLEYELVRVCKAREDAIQIFKRKLEQYEIPTDEVELPPLRVPVLRSVGIEDPFSTE